MSLKIPIARTAIPSPRPVVDDVSVRLTAAAVLALVAVTAATGQWWLYALLATDFALRATGRGRVSPLGALVVHVIRPRVRVAPRATPAAPKRFAAAIGATLTGAAFLLWAVGVVTGAGVTSAVVWGITAVLIAFPLLEAALGLCVGCKLYALLIRLGLLPADVCIDCGPANAVPKPREGES